MDDLAGAWKVLAAACAGVVWLLLMDEGQPTAVPGHLSELERADAVQTLNSTVLSVKLYSLTYDTSAYSCTHTSAYSPYSAHNVK